MSAQWFLLIMIMLSLLWDWFLEHLTEVQRKRPLPLEVSSIYDEERYSTYLAYVATRRKVELYRVIGSSVIDVLVIFSPFFAWIEMVSQGNSYLATGIAAIAIALLCMPVGYCTSRYLTLRVDEEYGLNHLSAVEFNRDYFKKTSFEIISTLVILELVVCLGEGYRQVSGFLAGNVPAVAGIALGLVAVTFLAAFVLSLGSFAVERSMYTYHSFPEGEVRDAIEEIIKGCRKRVHRLSVYNESSKSTEKNAFALKLPWFREIAVADNFLDDNSDGELLAVVAHEVGHLNRHRGVLDVVELLPLALFFAVVCAALMNPGAVGAFAEWVDGSFGLSSANYYLLACVVLNGIKPFAVALECLSNYSRRQEEYEADRAAVRAGYGTDLAEMLIKLDRDELRNVNPHPLVEAVEYDHPGTVNRLRAIYREIEQQRAK